MSRHVLCARLTEWLHARFADVSPEPAKDNPPSELADVKAEIMKNKKKIKSMMATLESLNKLLRTLAITIDPKFQVPDDPEGNSTGSEIRASFETEQESKEPTPGSHGKGAGHSAFYK